MKQTETTFVCTSEITIRETRTTRRSHKLIEKMISLYREMTRTIMFVVFTMLLVGFGGFSMAQDTDTGFDADPVFDLRADEVTGYSVSGMNLSEYENVNVANGNLTLNIPLASVTTDGGLTYSVAAYYNSKIWGQGTAEGPDNPQLNYYRGIENYGIGWDMRPPRLQATIACRIGADYPDCPDYDPDPEVENEIEYTVHSYVTQSGASHRLISVPPPEWEGKVFDDDDYDGEPDNPEGEQYCNSGGISGTGDLNGYRDCPCVVHPGRKQICYSWTDPLLRVTVDLSGSAPSATVESESGTLSRFNHLVDNRALLYDPGNPETLYLFREELDGFYLTSLERGPWEGGVPQNFIEFSYCDQDGTTGQCQGDDSHLEPWLVKDITASGEVPRSLTFQYDPHQNNSELTVLTKTTIPSFSGQTEIDFTYRAEDVDAGVDFYDDQSGEAPFLASITAHSNPESSLQWSFRNDFRGTPLEDGVRIRGFSLPTGAEVDYRYRGTPSWTLCSVPDPENEPPRDEVPRLTSGALYTRTLNSRDATGEVRIETTARVRNFNCLHDSPPDWMPVLPYPDSLPYPDDSFHQDVANSLGGSVYYWVWMETYAGAEDPLTMTTNSTAEIHRFHGRTDKEFSIDYLSTIPGVERENLGIVETVYRNPARLFIGNQHDPVDESFLLGWDGNVIRVLRHKRIQRQEQFFTIPCCPYPWDYFNQTVDSTTTITNATGPDVRDCNSLLGGMQTPDTEICQEVVADGEYDSAVNPFLRPLFESIDVANALIGAEASRYIQYEYDSPSTVSPVVPADVWDLGKRIFTGIKGAGAESDSEWTEQSTSKWELVQNDDDLPSPPGYLRLGKTWINPQDGDLCTDTIEGCVETVYTYDDTEGNQENLGNLVRVSRSGGLGSGFSEPVPDEVTDYIHGKPFRRWLDDGTNLLLLWERSIDPGTGLTRWYVDGSGAGNAYLYDSLGRVTDAAPIEGDHDGSLWSFTLQPYYGSHFDYLNPDLDNDSPCDTLACREARDASSYTLIDGLLSNPTLGVLRARLAVDGMGRPTQLTESYPGSASGNRTRYSLSYFYNAGLSPLNLCEKLPVSDNNLLFPARVNRSSEWIDGNGTIFSGCDTLKWSTTQYDGLNRPRIQHLPDTSEIKTVYTGDSTVTTTREVATTITPPETPMTTTATKDAFGRLRLLEEQVAAGQFIDSVYDYDAKDRLLSVLISNGTLSQSRSYEYSDAGFLMSATEPERYTQFLSYDALGNLRFENTKLNPGSSAPDSISTVNNFDGYSRLVSKEAGVQGGLLTMAEFEYSNTSVGSPDYNKLERSTQYNRFDNGGSPAEVTVNHNWTYGSPGGRIDTRTTSIGGTQHGIGGAGDGFELGYAYDAWGNVNRITHPSWGPWDGACPSDPLVEQLYTFDGSWLTDVALYRDNETTPFSKASLDYHPNGRPNETAMYAGNEHIATQTETKDGSGMSRPESMTFSVNGSTKWAQSNFAYDGSGNISSFDVWAEGYSASTRDFTYDGLNRITAFYDDDPLPRAYEYDLFGNITKLGNTTLYSHPDSNRLGTFAGVTIGADKWDERGNLTWLPAVPALQQREKSFTFSAEDRLMESADALSSGSKWRYAYDTSGERVVSWLKDDQGDTQEARITVRNGAGAVLTDWLLIPGSSLTRQRDYLYAGNRMITQIYWGQSLAKRRYAAVDHLGSTRYLLPVDDAGNVETGELLEYFPFGGFKEGGDDANSTHLFTGHERDLGMSLSQLDYMHARYYSPNLGRFMSVDPVGGTVGSSQSWNRYSYVLNNPLNLVDPTGMMNDVPNTMTGEAFGKKPLMQPATTPEGQRLDALFVSVYLSIGGSVLTGPIGGRVTTILLSGGWNLAGGATYRALDGDATTNASDLAAGIGDVGLGMLGGAGGVAISKASPATRALGTGGARAAAFLTSNGLPPLIDTAIDQTVSAMESSGILEKMLDMTSSIPNPNALDPSVNCHLTQQNTLVVSAGPPKMVEYLMYSSH